MIPMFNRRTRPVAGRVAALAAGLLVAGIAIQAQAGSGVTVHQPRQSADSLLQAWLRVPDLGSVNPAFTFVATSQSTYIRKHQRSSILAEFRVYRNNLDLSLSQAQQLDEWTTALKQHDHRYRVPGQWDPATLLADPSHMPALSALSAYGYCEPTHTIRVWDAAGTRRVQWQGGMDLQSLVSKQYIRVPASADWVTVVRPWGERVRVGVAAWNHGSADLTPGTRVITPVHFSGADTSWLNRALPEYLAHVAPGGHCTKWSTNDKDTAS